jgi:hypothetical protein
MTTRGAAGAQGPADKWPIRLLPPSTNLGYALQDLLVQREYCIQQPSQIREPDFLHSGPAGPTGATGPQGAQGAQGNQGPADK